MLLFVASAFLFKIFMVILSKQGFPCKMPDFCAAFGCTNSSDKPSCKERKISFHRFPLKDISRLKVWILKLRRQNYSPTSASVLCSVHFNEEDFEYQPFTNRRGLKKTAVPSKFSYVPVKITK